MVGPATLSLQPASDPRLYLVLSPGNGIATKLHGLWALVKSPHMADKLLVGCLFKDWSPQFHLAPSRFNQWQLRALVAGVVAELR